MTSRFGKPHQKPIYILIAVNLLIGGFVFRDYGLSWDEPLFYQYADALGYAYSPTEWFSGSFDLENSYGPSAEDHKTRGPAYLFLARNFVYGLIALGSDSASAWHLVNFVFFQLGVYCFYRLATRWLSGRAVFFASAFFSFQPLLWGHAFINPKDPPFLTFFLAAVCLGFEWVDEFHAAQNNFWKLFVAAVCLGIATSIRVLGPLAGMLVFGYGVASIFTRRGLKPAANPTKSAEADSPLNKFIQPIAVYIAIAIPVMLLTWPYLWENPIGRFVETLRFMSDNPTQLAVLFNGEIFRADDMPIRYIPFMLATTLTEPTWILFGLGFVVGIRKFLKADSSKLASLALTFGWFAIVIAYLLLQRPAVYDGLRHFLFILPPIFIVCGFAFEWVLENAHFWLRAGLVSLVFLPSLAGIIQLHPYEYAYYNAFVGGTSGAFRRYETEYWLTCYKDAVENFEALNHPSATLYVHREAYIAEYYASPLTIVRELREFREAVLPGDFVLVNTRTNDDRSIFRDAPPVVQIRRGGAIFCEVKQIP
jgi:hypothetical protein